MNIHSRLRLQMQRIRDRGSREVSLHPVLIMLTIMAIAVLLTHLLPAGKFDRVNDRIVPGTYQPVEKITGLEAFFATRAPTDRDQPARAAGVVSIFSAIPAGMAASSGVIFMILFAGGVFGLLGATGALDAGVDRLLYLTSGNVYLLTAGIMLVLSCCSTFLGFSSPYLALVPLVLRLSQKLGLPNLYAPLAVAFSSFIGYSASVTNPFALGVAQPIVGVPLFSGILPRLCCFVVLFLVGLTYVLLWLRRQPRINHVPERTPLTKRQTAVIGTVLIGGVGFVAGTALWSWQIPEMSGAFLALGLAVAVAGGLGPVQAAEAWLSGMRLLLLGCITIGLARGMAVILYSSQVMDEIVFSLAGHVSGHAPFAVALSLFASDMVLGLILPAPTAKAAVSLPLMAPIAHLAGVSPQVMISALLLGGGMTNIISPTDDLLVAVLAAAKVDFRQWVRFIAPLWLMFCLISVATIYLMTLLGV